MYSQIVYDPAWAFCQVKNGAKMVLLLYITARAEVGDTVFTENYSLYFFFCTVHASMNYTLLFATATSQRKNRAVALCTQSVLTKIELKEEAFFACCSTQQFTVNRC